MAKSATPKTQSPFVFQNIFQNATMDPAGRLLGRSARQPPRVPPGVCGVGFSKNNQGWEASY
jgi:hypothetical protein